MHIFENTVFGSARYQHAFDLGCGFESEIFARQLFRLQRFDMGFDFHLGADFI